MSNRWTTEDIIVLVYFRSRGVLTRSIVSLTNLKGGTPRNAKCLNQKLISLLANEPNAGHPALYNKTTETWDLEATDKWLVRRIVLSAKAKAREMFRDEGKAPLYYDNLKALMDFGSRERRIVGDIQDVNPVLAKLAWTVEFPASPATQTETIQSTATGSTNNESHSTPMTKLNEEFPRGSASERKFESSEPVDKHSSWQDTM